MKIYKLLYILSLTFYTSLNASSMDMEDLFSLDINQLQNITVITSTKTETKLSKSPSTLRVITDEMIKERGYLSLEEALGDLPGMQFRNIQGFNTYSFMRGAPNQNNLMLMMVDGVIINELNSGGFYGGLHYNLDNIKRIEVMYGPGSALYGTNAISGVINIITTDAKDEKSQGFFTSATYGSFNTASINVRTANFDKQNNSGYTLSAMYKTTSKTDLTGDKGANNWSDSMENFEEDLTLEGKFNYKDLQIGTIIQDKKASRATNYKSVGTDYYDKDTIWHIVFANIWAKHNLKIDENTELNSMFYYRNTTVEDDTIGYITNGISDNNQTGYYRPNNLYGVEERLVYKGVNNLDLTLGLLYEYEQLADGFSKSYSNSYLIKPQAPTTPSMINNSLVSFYTQGNYDINEHFTLTAGIRHEHSSTYDTENIPRASLIFSKNNTIVKLIYAEAFRAPKPWDYTDNNGTINTNLLPEEMQSYELYLEQSFNNNLKADLSIFKNAITNKLSSDGNGGWINLGKLNTDGIEISLIHLSNTIKSYLNYTYTDSKDENNIDIDEIAKHTANAGLTYKANKKYLAHINLNYIGKKKNPAQASEYIDPYTILSANISYKWTKDINIEIIAKNILDEVYYHTSNTSVTKYRQDERSFFIKGRYKF